MDPTATPLRLPAEYGTVRRTMAWPEVSRRLGEALRYWLATVRPDGRPHVVPVDGLWLDDAWYSGGHPSTVHQRNLRHSPEMVVHLEDAGRAVVAEGRGVVVAADAALADRLVAASKEKYGYGPPAAVYRDGVWRLRPRRVLAWDTFPDDATRFDFPDGSATSGRHGGGDVR
jgi:hypothetical protein